MLINELLSPSRAICALEGGSKKRTLEIVSRHIAEQQPEMTAAEIFSALINRERLGSTGIGEGVAIPHCRLSDCHQALGILIQLDQAIEFDAIDGKPVDLLFVLLVPEEACDEHLQTLGNLAELFSQETFRERLRSAQSNRSLYNAAVEFQAD